MTKEELIEALIKDVERIPEGKFVLVLPLWCKSYPEMVAMVEAGNAIWNEPIPEVKA